MKQNETKGAADSPARQPAFVHIEIVVLFEVGNGGGGRAAAVVGRAAGGLGAPLLLAAGK